MLRSFEVCLSFLVFSFGRPQLFVFLGIKSIEIEALLGSWPLNRPIKSLATGWLVQPRFVRRDVPHVREVFLFLDDDEGGAPVFWDRRRAPARSTTTHDSHTCLGSHACARRAGAPIRATNSCGRRRRCPIHLDPPKRGTDDAHPYPGPPD